MLVLFSSFKPTMQAVEPPIYYVLELTGAWLTIFPSIINGTELSAEEFHDVLIIQYGELLSNFPLKCDGCNAHFTLQHALGCKKGGLVIFRHKEVQDTLAHSAHLATKTFTPSAVHDEPLIRSNCIFEDEKALNQPTGPHHSGSGRRRQKGGSLDKKVLESQEKEKKCKYLENWFKQRHHFNPFVVSVDGLLG
jgi:hypothetical protein